MPGWLSGLPGGWALSIRVQPGPRTAVRIERGDASRCKRGLVSAGLDVAALLARRLGPGAAAADPAAGGRAPSTYQGDAP
jgi:hypothetical protein